MVALQVRKKSFVDECSEIKVWWSEPIHYTKLERDRERERDLGFHEICLTFAGLMIELAEPAYELDDPWKVEEIERRKRSRWSQILVILSGFENLGWRWRKRKLDIFPENIWIFLRKCQTSIFRDNSDDATICCRWR